MSTSLQKQVLIDARALIADKNNWFGGSGDGINMWHGKDNPRCAWLAVEAAAHKLGFLPYATRWGAGKDHQIQLEDQLCSMLIPGPYKHDDISDPAVTAVVYFNNRESHEDVLKLFDTAIASC